MHGQEQIMTNHNNNNKVVIIMCEVVKTMIDTLAL